MKNNYKQNLISGTVLFVFAAVYFFMAFDISAFRGLGSTPLTAQFMPKFWGICLMILSALVIIRGARQYSACKKSPETEKEKGKDGKDWWYWNYAVVLTFVVLALYVALLGPLGFIVATMLYIFFGILAITPPYKKKNYVLAAVVAVVAAVLLDYVFVVLLNVLLPRGLIGF